MFRNMNSGYSGFSMSKRAVEAYENGERPISKWSKKDLLEGIKQLAGEKTLNFNYDSLKKIPVDVLKELFLIKTSWHHTSSRCNKTDFYSLDQDAVYSITEDKLSAAFENAKRKSENKQEKYKGSIEYLEWSGTRKYPKATKCTLKDVYIEEKGCFYIISDSSGKQILKKKIGSNGTIVRKEEEL